MNKSKTFMIVSISLLIVTIIASTVTYAWYTWSTTSENETKIVTSMGAAKVFFDGGASITGVKLKPTADKSNGIVKNIKVKTDKDTAYKISFNLYLDIISLDNGLKDASFKYALYKTGVTDAVASGNFLNSSLQPCETNSTSHIVLVNDETITTTEQEYKLYIWIDGTMDNPESMQNQNFNFKLHADGQNAVMGETLVQHISNLYTPNSAAENNGITYNLDTTHYLMNDRLGTESVGIDNGNIRYYGASPNNYIDIGDVYEEDFTYNNWETLGYIYPDSAECYSENEWYTGNDCNIYWEENGFQSVDECITERLSFLKEDTGFSSVDELCGTTTIAAGTPILYSIIGLFKNVELSDGTKKDLIKVIRNESIGDYSWDQSPSNVNNGIGINEWSQADLMKLLNPDYENETVGGSLYWNSEAGTCYGDDGSGELKGISCDFTNIGLSANARNKIETVKWNIGGWNDTSVYPNQIYEYERGKNVIQNTSDGIKRTTVWPGKVALAYSSDYGYAACLDSCDETLDNYENNYDNCIGTNWMYSRMTFTGNNNSWLLTPLSSNASYAWYVNWGGNVYDIWVSDTSSVSPVFYLDSALGIVSGDGSEGSPYIVQ